MAAISVYSFSPLQHWPKNGQYGIQNNIYIHTRVQSQNHFSNPKISK